jgi:hypothetical protein
MAKLNNKEKLVNLKNEMASEVGVKFTEYNGDLTSKQCGTVGGAMVRKMIDSYKG